MPAHLYALKAKKQKEIEELQKCQGLLEKKQVEFDENAEKCLDPELSSKKWHGDHATEFDDIRESGIEAPYLEIAGTQFSDVFAVIAEKITSLLKEIEEIQQQIDSILAARAAQAAEAAGVIR